MDVVVAGVVGVLVESLFPSRQDSLCSSAPTSRMSFVIGRFSVRVLSDCLYATRSITCRTRPSSDGKTSVTSAIGQPFRFVKMLLSFTSTTSPTMKFLDFAVHFCLVCRDDRYSVFHLDQNSLARYCTRLQCFLEYMSGLSNFPGGGKTTLFLNVSN